MYAGNRNNPLDFIGALGVSEKQERNCYGLLKLFKKNDCGLDWNKFYKLAVHLGREQSDLAFKDFIIKLIARYLQEIGRSNMAWEGNRFAPPARIRCGYAYA